MLEQLSIFTENSQGAMQKITQVLADNDINIWGSVTNDSAEYGIVRMVVSDAHKAKELLTARSYMCKLSDVIGVRLEDEVGALNELLIAASESHINIDYIYLSFERASSKPVLILHTIDAYEVEECLASRGFTVL